jgi:hypothetical protein
VSRPPGEDAAPAEADIGRRLEEWGSVYDHVFDGAPRPPWATDEALMKI